MARSFAQKLSDARLMSAGIKAHKAELASVSVGEEQAEAIEALSAALQEIDSRQEKLKAELKTCTAELSEKTKQLDTSMMDAKKRIKLVIAQSGWQEFGIADKK